MFRSPGSPIVNLWDSVNDGIHWILGFPIRISSGITVHITLPTLFGGLARPSSPLICLGIHRVRLFA